jgi:predicted solute-binding protein
MRFAYRPEYASEVFATSLRERRWETIAHPAPGELLLAGSAEIVMTPPIEYATSLGVVDYALVPGVGIATRGFAGLIKLAFNRGLVNIETVATSDVESSESVLSQIILSEKHDLDPTFVARKESDCAAMLGSADAALLVGDDALFRCPADIPHFDLTDEWEDMTDGPLPYLITWGRIGSVSQAELDALSEARDAAVLTLADTAARHEHSREAQRFHERYLQGAISYTIGDDELDALDHFYRYAFYYGKIIDIPTIKMLPDGDVAPRGSSAPEPGQKNERRE